MLKKSSPLKQLGQMEPNLAEMVPGCVPFKIVSPNLPKTYRSFNDILRCGLIHLMQLELNLIFICFKLAYLFGWFGIDNQTSFQRSPSLSKKKLNLSENK
jgi:hypothetical protein